MSTCADLDRIYYPTFSSNWDDTALRERVLKHLHADSVVLDLGAGSGFVEQVNFRGLVARVCGVDPCEEVLRNPHLDCAKVGSAEAIPWPDETFDVVFSDNVLEHLADPAQAFKEVRRVLKRGGVFIAKTPNRWHYVTVASRLTPTSFHRFYNGLRGRKEDDTFPTLYRANSRRQLKKLAAETAFEECVIECIEGRPEYLRLFPWLYRAGIAWERVVNRFEIFAPMRVVLIAEFRKGAC